MSESNPSADSFGDEIEVLCDRFEAEWKAGVRPQIEPYLANVPESARAGLARELLKLDIHYRREHDETILPRDYTPRFPEHVSLIETLLAARSLSGQSMKLARAGRYRVESRIGHGGMGDVYRAHDPDLCRPLAVKVLKDEYKERPEMVARFLEEARITGQLQHPGVPPIHEIGRLPDRRPFLAMKLIEGRTLSELLTQRKTLADGLPRFLMIFEQVCQTVACANSRRVIHRDLKPANVMIGAFGEVQVMDWGLAKALAPEGDSRAQFLDRIADTLSPSQHDTAVNPTRPGQVLGTPAYMSPEQAEGRLDEIDERSDVFGLGAILHEILTGRPPFPGAERKLVQPGTSYVPPSPPRSLGAGVPSALEAVCLKALAKSREERYATANELAEEVQHWRADEPVAAHREPWTVRARRLLGRHQKLATAMAAALVVAAVILAGATVLLMAANDREQQARGRERHARERAETNLRVAIQAIDGLSRVSESPELKALAMEPLRRDLLGQARDFYEQLARQESDDIGLQAERGRAYLRLADITEALGDRQSAIDLARQGQDIFEGLCQSFPEVGEYQDGLAMALIAKGRNCDEEKKYPAAQQALERAVAIREKLHAAQGGERVYCFRLAVTLDHLGVLYLRGLGSIPEGVAALERARSLCKKLMDDAPGVPDYPSQLARTLSDLGYLEDLDGDFVRGVAVKTEAVNLLEGLVKDHPRVAEYQFRLGVALTHLAASYSNLRKPEQAMGPAKRAVDVTDALVHFHPNVPEYQRHLSLVHVNHAACLAQLGEHQRASDEVESAVAKLGSGPAFYDGACVYCLCSTAAGRDMELAPAERAKLAAKYLDRAMALLIDADKDGYFKQAQGISVLQTDHDLDPLRQREDFQKLIRRLESDPTKAGTAERKH